MLVVGEAFFDYDEIVRRGSLAFSRIDAAVASWAERQRAPTSALARQGATASPPGLVNRRISDRDGFTGCVEVYPQDTKVRFKMLNPRSRPGGGLRGKVKGFSKQSRRNAIFTLRNKRPDVRWVAFVTLTYPAAFPEPGKVKEHLSKWLKRLRRLHPGVNYFWVLELQERGALHLHLLVDRFVPRDWLSASWYEVVGSGDELHLKAGTSVDRVRNRNKLTSYLCGKYLNKEAQKNFTDWVGRVWGCSRGLLAEPERTPMGGSFRDMARALRPLRRFVKSRHRPWRWKGGGFTVYGITPHGVERLLSSGIASVLC